jgi:hypothetical protein
MKERPKCRRCGGPLDFWQEPDDGLSDNGGEWHWICNNLAGKHTPIRNDEEHWKRWETLPDNVKLILTGDAE